MPVARSPEQLRAEIRPYISDARALDAIAAVPRDRFVPPDLSDDAWANNALPIGCGQTISQPLVVARMCELLRIGPEARVLDVGTGSGYAAAVLARLAAHVWSIERHAELSHGAAANLAAAGVRNVTLAVGDGTLGYAAAAPYDAIHVAAAARRVPPALVQQLAVGGRLVLPLGKRLQRLALVTRTEEGTQQRVLERVRFVPLIGA